MLAAACAAYYAAMLATMVVFSSVPPLHKRYLAYGKSAWRGKRPDGPIGKVAERLLGAKVPKAWFAHFYWVGVLATAAVWAWQQPKRPWLLAAFGTHVLRRTVEQQVLFGSNHKSVMSLGHYVAGLSFYIVTPVALALPSTFTNHWRLAPAVALFLAANALQSWHHAILADTRRKTLQKSKGRTPYGLAPRRGLFALVACPHYLCEVLLYAALALMADPAGPAAGLPWLVALWTAVTLTLVARDSLQWHREQWRRAPRAVQRAHSHIPRLRRLVPWVL